MGIALRIDVDNPFGYATFFKKVLNRMSLDYNIIPRWKSLGYLEQAKQLWNYLEQKRVPTTWFFRNATAPKATDLMKFKTGLHSLALHAERTDTFENFVREITEWSHRFGESPSGFSKHGSGDMKLSRKHVMEYDEEKFSEFGLSSKLKFFIGNGSDYKESIQYKDSFINFPSVVWLDNQELHGSDFSLDDVITHARDNPVIVLLHPMWWCTRGDVKESLVYLIENSEFQTVSEVLGIK